MHSRKECPQCAYGTSQRGAKGDKAMRRHAAYHGKNHRPGTTVGQKQFKGFKQVGSKKGKGK